MASILCSAQRARLGRASGWCPTELTLRPDVKVVPWMWLLNGKKRTHYAASWTVRLLALLTCSDSTQLVNAHELAVISGMAAAYRLGAEYPEELEGDSFALLCFRLYLLLSHATWYKKGAHRPSPKAA